MSSLSVGKEVPRRPIEMPPLPPEPAQDIAQNPELIAQDTSPEESHGTHAQAVESNQQEEQKSSVPATAPEPRESAQAKNFRELREKADRTARERDELAQRLKELESKITQKEDYNLSPDDLVEGKHLSRIIQNQKQLEEKLKQYEQQRHMTEAEMRLKSKYPDFDSVVNPDNIQKLNEVDPDSVTVLQAAAHNPEAALSMAYKAIKFNGIVKDVPKFSEDTARAQQNAAKPRPLNTVAAQHSESPISRMNAFASGQLTDEIKQQLLKEMNESRRGY